MEDSVKKTRTLALVKPSAVQEGYERPVLVRIHRAGFRVVRSQVCRLTRTQAEIFYAARRCDPRCAEMVARLSGGMLSAHVLEREGAVGEWLRLAGHPEPGRAAAGTIRRDFVRQGSGFEAVVHGSDSEESAAREIKFFFGAGRG